MISCVIKGVLCKKKAARELLVGLEWVPVCDECSITQILRGAKCRHLGAGEPKTVHKHTGGCGCKGQVRISG